MDLAKSNVGKPFDLISSFNHKIQFSTNNHQTVKDNNEKKKQIRSDAMKVVKRYKNARGKFE